MANNVISSHPFITEQDYILEKNFKEKNNDENKYDCMQIYFPILDYILLSILSLRAEDKGHCREIKLQVEIIHEMLDRKVGSENSHFILWELSAYVFMEKKDITLQ